ncbi:forkhead box protein M1 isoform X3 [Phyllopteryx taeniolatus]|uniref:forkhead box protein M1 isoform X3 n=1 Tax=Phyllopteryx taeniolatus TaxID=161469 RepID=UPI002AD23AEE|nr:forkhead box protein M1 isoform X3 [Phyllopteryx taeniolatus]
MRRSPRRPLILKRRKLPFQLNHPPAGPHASVPQGDPASSSAPEHFPDGVRVLDHPVFPGTQVVVIPKTAERHSVIEALTVKGKESGVQGPNKFILLGESGSLHSGSLCQTDEAAGFPASAVGQRVSQSAAFIGIKQVQKEEDGNRFDDSLTNMQWLERSDALQPGPGDDNFDKENQTAVAVLERRPNILHSVCEAACGSPSKTPKTPAGPGARPKNAASEKPPFSYMAMIQFAINSSRNGLMTLNEIYKWLQHHFDFFGDENRRGWKNSVRHNLSLHKMFLRKMSPNGKVSFWTVRPDANRGLTLDQVYRAGCNPVAARFAQPVLSSPYQQQQQQQMPSGRKKAPPGCEKRLKPLLPRTPSYLIPVQLPLSATVCLPSSFPLAPPQARHVASSSCKAKRSGEAPKVALAKNDAPRAKVLKAEAERVRRSPKALARKQQAGRSRRKQRLVRSQHEEPLLVCSQDSEVDSGISAASSCPDAEADHQQGRLRFYETPVKAGRRRLVSSTPSKPPVENCGQSALDFSPIRTPLHDYPAFNLSSTPLEDWALFSDATSPVWQSACSRELLDGGDTPPADRSLAEGLVLDTTGDSLSKILVDFSLEDIHDLGLADVNLSEISLSEIIPSEIIPQFK